MSRYDDLTSELLMGMRVYGVKYQRIALHAPFGLRYDDAPGRAQLHFVGRGSLLIRSASGVLYPLQAGDALLIPHGKAHALISSEEVTCEPLSTFTSKPICDGVCAINDAPDGSVCPDDSDVILFSACMAFELGGMQPLVHTMPDVMLVSTLRAQYPKPASVRLALPAFCRGWRTWWRHRLCAAGWKTAAARAAGWCRRCAIRASVRRWRQCTARRGKTGRSRAWRVNPAAHARCLPHAFRAPPA